MIIVVAAEKAEKLQPVELLMEAFDVFSTGRS